MIAKLRGMNQSSSRPYFVNAFADFMLIGGASILFLALCAFVFKLNIEHLYPIAFWLNWVCNHPHFSATHYRLYAHREHSKLFPMTAWVIPSLIAIAAVASLQSADRMAPAFVKLYLLWSPYHYAGQVLGITLIYFARSGAKLSRFERNLWLFFCFSIFAASTVGAETARIDRHFYGILYPSLSLPDAFHRAVSFSMYASGAAVFAFWLKRRFSSEPAHWIVLLPAVSFYAWFIAGSRYSEFNLFVPFFHSAQYLIVAWTVQIAERSTKPGPRTSFSRWMKIESAKWYALNIGGGVLLFYLLPRLGKIAGSSLSVAEPVIIAAVQLHHFFVDGVIWKIKSTHGVNLVRTDLSQSKLNWEQAT